MTGILRGHVHQLIGAGRPRSVELLCQQQKRFAGDLPVKSNKYIEDWATFRENVEYTYKWDAKTWRRLGLWLFAFPFGIYQITCAEFDKVDSKYGREPRDFMGDVKKR